MKGKVKVILITLLVLLVGTGVLLWKLNGISQEQEKLEKANLKEERDLLEEQKGKVIDNVKDVDIIPLYMTGDHKDVVTTTYNSVAEVYSVKKSAQAEETLTDIKKNRVFTLEDALWAYNPYGTNRNSMYVYFGTNGKTYCRYTISVDNPKIPDFTRTAYGTGQGKLTKEHEYQLLGLVAGEKNYITMKLYNAKNELSEVKTFAVRIPKSRVGATQILPSVKGRSKTEITNGLYVVFQDGAKTASGEKKCAILLYDNSGVLRGEIPTDRYCGRNLENVYDTLLYASSATQLAQVNQLGQVTNTVSTKGYRQSGEFAYDGYGNVYVIATKAGKKATPQSKVLEIALEDGTTTLMVDMDTLFKNVYNKAAKRAKKADVDWVGLNSVQVAGTNKLILSSKKLSSIIKVSNIGSLLPKIDYIIADPKLYKGYKGLAKKVLKKSSGEDATAAPSETPAVRNILKKKVTPEPFQSQYGQEAVTYQKKGKRLSFLNSNVGSNAKNTGESYYYSYKVDETAKTYQLVNKKALDQTKRDGNVIAGKTTYVYCCSDEGLFVEGDWNGRVVKQFKMGKRPYRVYKNDFKGFWFY